MLAVGDGPTLVFLRRLLDQVIHTRQLGLVVGAGLLLGGGLGRPGGWPLAWVALVPLWMDLTGRPIGGAAGRGLAWGLAYHGAALVWLLGLHPLTWLGLPWGTSLIIAVTCWLAVSLWGAVMVAIWAAGVSLVKAPLQQWAVGIALWAVLENLWGQSPLWWTTLALTQSPGNLAVLHLGQGAGPAGVSILIVAVNGGLALAWRHRNGAWLGVALSVWVMGHAVGLSLYGLPLQDRPDNALHVGLIQGNIPNREKFTTAGRAHTAQVYTSGYRDLADRGVNLVLTPEGALPYAEVAAEAVAPDLFAAIRNYKVPLILGVYGQSGHGRPTNGLALILGDGRVHGRYDKVRLVPLGEYIPGEDRLNGLGIPVQRLSPVGEGFVPGRPDQVFRTPWGPAGVALCYESAYPDRFRTQVQAGATLLLTAANNDPYSPRMMAQHQALEVMRAIETDRWLARATNTGYSSLIDPHGQVHWQSQANQVETQTVTLYRRPTETPWVRWGDWLTPSLMGLAVLGLAAGRWRPG